MTREDAHLNAALRHLGAAYHATLEGAGAASDVARAVAAVADARDPGVPDSGRPAANGDGRQRGWRRRGWQIRDVMTTDVFTADRDMTCKRAARLMTFQRLTAIPVVDESRQVLGMVSEADVLRKQDRHSVRSAVDLFRRHGEQSLREARTVGGLMTSPALTIHPNAPPNAAARLMNARHIRRLPVVDDAGALVGVVSRRDLLKVFIRPDSDIEAEIGDVLSSILLENADAITASVREGVVDLTGTVPDKGVVAAAAGLAADVPGVVTVTSRLGVKARPEARRPH